MELTAKQAAFVDYYIKTGNATEAARLAGYKCKNESTLRSIGAENLAKLAEVIRERMQQIASDRIADAQEVMEYLTGVMRREQTECVVVTCVEEQSRYVPDEDGKLRKETTRVETPRVVEIPARLSDANKAAELIGKRLMLWTPERDKGQEERQTGVVMLVPVDGEEDAGDV